MKVGIFSGSFNPIHMGHLMLASYFVEYGVHDEVWMSVTPHNPLRQRNLPQNDHHRCAMLRQAIEPIHGVCYCDIELSLPQPSYTINTLDALREKYPQHSFELIIGADNWLIFDKWREARRIIDEYGVCVYPRKGYEVNPDDLPAGVSYVEAPMVELSSTRIREGIAAGRDMRAFVPHGVYDYICHNNLYKG